jgi:addiction module HigA family antidote
MKSYRISEVHLGRAPTMAKSRKVFAVHPGEILKTEFMEPMGLSAFELAKALNFPGIYDVVRGDRAISADPAIRLGEALRSARAVSAQSSKRLRSENRGG